MAASSKRGIGRPEVPKLQSITLNFDQETLENIEVYWRKNMYRTRSAFITEAVADKMESIKCPFCGAVNPKGGRICSVCLRPLSDEEAASVKVSVQKKD